VSLMIDPDKLGTELVPQSKQLPQEPPPIGRLKRRPASLAKLSAFAGIGFFVLLFAAEHTAATPWRPSTMIGAFGGKEKTAEMMASLEAARALTAMQEQEKARAQQEVEVLRANQDRLTRAYQAEYDRGTELIRAGAAAAQEVLKASTMAKVHALQGKMANANLGNQASMWCKLMGLFGGPDCSEATESYAADQRASIQREIIGGWKEANAEISQLARTWADGLPDPLELIDQAKRQGQPFNPLPRAPAPPRPDLAQPPAN
jgi:hypothetical protein